MLNLSWHLLSVDQGIHSDLGRKVTVGPGHKKPTDYLRPVPSAFHRNETYKGV